MSADDINFGRLIERVDNHDQILSDMKDVLKELSHNIRNLIDSKADKEEVSAVNKRMIILETWSWKIVGALSLISLFVVPVLQEWIKDKFNG